jgi:hypothetical protein
MNTKIHTMVGILIILPGLVFPAALLAQETGMTVTGANPHEGEQGAGLEGDPLPVEISGTGFDDTVDKVSFKLPCNKKNCPDSEDITVESFEVVDDAEKGTFIRAKIRISLSAPTKSFDIAVRSTRGRGGKGTTYKGEGLFTVKLRPNQELLSCSDVVVDTETHPYLGTCTCQFVWNGDDAFLPALAGSCFTSETLYIKHRFRGDISEDPGNQSTITAVPCGTVSGQVCSDTGGVVPPLEFKGRSVIANSRHRAAIRFLDIRFKDVARGCGEEDIQAAVSYILDAATPDPRIPDPLGRNSFLNVDNIGIFSDDDPLCNGIEIIRSDEYTGKYSPPPPPGDPELVARDWKIMAADNLISAGSYEHAGIVMLGIMPLESINPPAVFGNTIGAAADAEYCDDTYPPMGIWFGDLTRDPDNQIDGVVENNEIDMTNGCNDTGTGVVIIGDPADEQTTVKVNKNTITGAQLGVYVDCDVSAVNFSGNNLNGKDLDEYDRPLGILSDAQSTRTKGKPNNISGYTTDIDSSRAGCDP